MPKDAKKNVDRYKIRGGDVNEFEFHKNQEQFMAKPVVAKGPKPKLKSTKAANTKKTAGPKAATKK